MLPNEKIEDYKRNYSNCPTSFYAWKNLDNAFVMDEAQTRRIPNENVPNRMGKSEFMVTGDPGQVDLPRRTISGLKEALLILKDIEGLELYILMIKIYVIG
jgi:phosphate starvation-inducible PhoH-like protein